MVADAGGVVADAGAKTSLSPYEEFCLKTMDCSEGFVGAETACIA